MKKKHKRTPEQLKKIYERQRLSMEGNLKNKEVVMTNIKSDSNSKIIDYYKKDNSYSPQNEVSNETIKKLLTDGGLKCVLKPNPQSRPDLSIVLGFSKLTFNEKEKMISVQVTLDEDNDDDIKDHFTTKLVEDMDSYWVQLVEDTIENMKGMIHDHYPDYTLMTTNVVLSDVMEKSQQTIRMEISEPNDGKEGRILPPNTNDKFNMSLRDITGGNR